MKDQEATPATNETFQLAEGPVWDASTNRARWVDIVGHMLFEGELVGDELRVTRRTRFPTFVSAVAASDAGDLLVAVGDSLVVVNPAGSHSARLRVLPQGFDSRLNDGAVDPAGRFLVGSLALSNVAPHREVLLSVDHDAQVRLLDDDLGLSNGLAWSTLGNRLYSVDSLVRRVYVRDYDASSGAVGARTVFLQLTDGLPDGIAMDVEDHLWIAVWGAGEIRRYSPDGNQVARISVPAPHTSSVSFVGPRLNRLLITTARRDLSSSEIARCPRSGAIFSAVVDVPGVPTSSWRGPWGQP